MGIQYHSLAACPKYDALSYSWGDTAKDKALPECRDGGFFISARLELALKHLRDPFDTFYSGWTPSASTSETCRKKAFR